MDDVTFENLTLDPDGPGEDDDFDLLDPPMETAAAQCIWRQFAGLAGGVKRGGT